MHTYATAALGFFLLNGITVALEAPAGDPSIDASLYSTFRRMTKYAAASYASDCPIPPNNSTVVQYFDNATTDTQATLFRDDAREELIIAFRGTSNLKDFTSDAAQTLVPLTAVKTEDCGSNCRVQEGVHKAWNSVSTSIVAVMQDQISAHPGYHPIVTGHSLGASIASLSSASLVHYFPDLTTYTLGQFRTGNPAYAAYIDRILPFPNMYRITHTNDGIPQTIHKSSGYLHHSTEFWELEPFGPKNTYKCQPGDDDECNQSTFGLGIGGVVTLEGINPAHTCYTGIPIGNPLDGGAGVCGQASLVPQDCSTSL